MKIKIIEKIATFDNGEQFRIGDKVKLKLIGKEEIKGKIMEISDIRPDNCFYISLDSNNDYVLVTAKKLEYIKHLPDNNIMG